MLSKKDKRVFFMISYIPIWIIFYIKAIFYTPTDKCKFYYYLKYIVNTLKKIKPNNKILMNELTFYRLVISLFFLVFSLYFVIKFIKILFPKTQTTPELEIIRVKNISIDYITNYFSLYLFPFFTLNVINLMNIIIFIVIFMVAIYIYIKNDIVYINPFLNLLGFKVYIVEVKRKKFKKENKFIVSNDGAEINIKEIKNENNIKNKFIINISKSSESIEEVYLITSKERYEIKGKFYGLYKFENNFYFEKMTLKNKIVIKILEIFNII